MKKFFLMVLFFFSFQIFPDSNERFIEYLYINANTGDSSGGHSALKIGDLVYHLQYYPDEIFRIEREYWDGFYYLYGIQENRTTFVHKIQVSQATWEKVRNRLNVAFLIQTKHLDILQSLKSTKDIFEVFLSKEKKLKLKGLGYFSKSQKSPKLVELYNQVETIYGIGYINSLISNLKKQMNNLEYTQIPIDETKISKENYNYQGNFASDTYLNILYKIQALEILKEGRGLASQTYFPVYDDLNKADYKPSQTERELLVRFQTNLQKNLTRLIHSKREDWGYAMLIGMARFLVINKSLEENKLYFLDCFGNSYFLIKKKVISNLKHHKKLKHDSYRLFEEAKSLFFSDLGTNFELDYQLLEDVANRYEELRNGINKFIPVRSISGKLIPQKTGVVSLFHKFPSRDKIEANLKIAKENETKYQKKLQEIYDYHLINNNCTTEVFTYLNSAFHFSQKESEKRLGGFIQGNDLFVFVPFYAYYKVGKSYNVKSSKEILSVRRKMVKKFAEKGNEFWVKLRESNTITSKIYQFNPDDSWFVFFTDDTIIFRPFMGFVNLLVGVTETGYGIFQLPLDKGDRLLKGLKGTFFSLPELAFFNIRKGTFSILDKDKLEWLQKEAKEELNRSD